MAQKVLVHMVDDLDGSETPDIETVTFGLDGVQYEIDLAPKNAGVLRESLAEFVDQGRRVGGRLKRGTATKTAAAAVKPVTNRDQTKAVREWAIGAGYELSNRGRIPAHIVTAFDEAHTPAEPKKGKRSRRKSPAPQFSS